MSTPMPNLNNKTLAETGSVYVYPTVYAQPPAYQGKDNSGLYMLLGFGGLAAFLILNKRKKRGR